MATAAKALALRTCCFKQGVDKACRSSRIRSVQFAHVLGRLEATLKVLFWLAAGDVLTELSNADAQESFAYTVIKVGT